MDVRLHIDLSEHCIETGIKKAYNQAIAAYFNKNTDNKAYIEKIVEMTLYALKNFDFAQLRSCYPQLAGNTKIPALLTIDQDSYKIWLGDQEITPRMKKAFTVQV